MKTARLKELETNLHRNPARMEIVLAELVDAGLLSGEELSIQAGSTFARSYRQDIADTRILEDASGEVLQVDTHREGLYDQLPYHLFHRPEPFGTTRLLKNRLAESEAARAREAAARAFFHPFEQVLNATAIKVALQEKKLTDAFHSPLYRSLLRKLWPRCTKVKTDRLPLLAYVLPLAHSISGDLALMQPCYQSLLLAPVRLTYRYGALPSDPVDPFAAGNTLGSDLTLGGLPREELPMLEITVGPLGRNQADEFLPGEAGTAMLDLLNDCLVPYEVDVRVNLTLVAGAEDLQLAADRSPASRLGISATLIPTP